MVFVANVMAVERAITRPSEARVTLIRAQSDPESRESSWARLAGGGVDIHPIVAPGVNHVNIAKEPYVDLLAAELSRVVKAASEPLEPQSTAALSVD